MISITIHVNAENKTIKKRNLNNDIFDGCMFFQNYVMLGSPESGKTTIFFIFK